MGRKRILKHKIKKNSKEFDISTILVAIPVFNEYKYINEILCTVKNYSKDILVIDDGSTDGTSSELRKYTDIKILTHTINLGYGQSVIDAFRYAYDNNYEWVITLDCDSQHEPSYLLDFYNEIEKNMFDIISGTRYIQKLGIESKPPPADRVVINKLITSILNRKLKLNLTDSFCGFKAYRVLSVLSLELNEKGYGLPLQLWILASKANLRICEISVPMIYHDSQRNFCGIFENAYNRLNYYVKIIEKELGYTIDKDIRQYFSSSPERCYICES